MFARAMYQVYEINDDWLIRVTWQISILLVSSSCHLFDIMSKFTSMFTDLELGTHILRMDIYYEGRLPLVVWLVKWSSLLSILQIVVMILPVLLWPLCLFWCPVCKCIMRAVKVTLELNQTLVQHIFLVLLSRIIKVFTAFFSPILVKRQF